MNHVVSVIILPPSQILRLRSEDDGSIIVDTRITSLKVPGAAPLLNTKDQNFQVSVTLEGRKFALGSVPLNTTGTEFPLSLDFLSPRKEPYTITCSAEVSGKTYETTNQLLYLEPPVEGSVTKQDLRTGSLLVKSGNTWEPILPIGFYTSFDGFLVNVSNVDLIKARGDGRMNLIHPVPTFDNMTALESMLDRMEELGLWLIYDMRNTYKNLTSVAEQVNMIKDRPNLLLWYTADEPDGPGDPLNATAIAKAFINELDGGGYHPVSLALNCENHYFEDYSTGADVVLQDACIDYGCCGCDNCIGSFEDISTRVDEFKQRLDLLGRGRSTAVWSVPQAFGNQTFWPRYPTGQEWLVESVVAINHGSLGITPWADPSTTEIDDASSTLAATGSQIIQFLANPLAEITHIIQDGVDIAFWTIPSTKRALMLVANMNSQSISIVIGGAAGTIVEVLNSGAALNIEQAGQTVLSLDGIGTAGYIFEEGMSVETRIVS
ncbi:hypothetical protein Clacol_003488 [Clathrus columnatus]|uniref:Uncharacterized protein n=1 Tax=Clathrus columnatus TaxID=1419009 RepID=A0AAV5A8B7_9AGAM|nr:hypothetical protein Clacol_003488 [Clathrus columnatus]